MTVLIGSPVDAPAAGGASLRGASTMGLGNSLMNSGHHLTGSVEPGHASTSAIIAQTCLRAGGKLCLYSPVDRSDDASAATSNLTIREIVYGDNGTPSVPVPPTHLDQILASQPDVVICGPLITNGGPDFNYAGEGKELTALIAEAILGYGGLPVFISEFPSGVDAVSTSRT